MRQPGINEKYVRSDDASRKWHLTSMVTEAKDTATTICKMHVLKPLLSGSVHGVGGVVTFPDICIYCLHPELKKKEELCLQPSLAATRTQSTDTEITVPAENYAGEQRFILPLTAGTKNLLWTISAVYPDGSIYQVALGSKDLIEEPIQLLVTCR